MRSMHREGIVLAMSATLMWGAFPIYFKSLEHVGSWLTLGHRALWALPFLVFVVGMHRQWDEASTGLREWRELRLLFIGAVCVGTSWWLYIWAAHNERIVEASMGYYLTPAMSIVVGMIIFSERLSKLQWTGVALSSLGVLNLMVALGYVPWVGIALGLAFGIYSGVRKLCKTGSSAGLLVENLMMMPLGLVAFLLADAQVEVDLVDTVMLICSGAVTVVPILCYIAASRRLPLTTLGNLFYIAPTIGFLVGVLLYDEPFTATHAITFALIWIGLAVFALADQRAARSTVE